MTDELLPYYDRELAFLRSMAAEFAQRHKKIAARLQLAHGESKDPHVERLIQGVAFLNARVRHKLDDDFPELAEAMLQVVYPHYVRPVPSMSIVQFELDRSQGELLKGFEVPPETPIETESESESGAECRFRTSYPVHLWPLRVESASLLPRPFLSPKTRGAELAQSVLRLTLKGISKSLPLHKLALDKLRFYLHAGPSANVYKLYELLFTRVLEVAIAPEAETSRVQTLPPNCIQPVGFERNEGMLPYEARSFLGYRLLSEYFAFPQKFLFFDLTGLESRTAHLDGDTLELFIYLDRRDEDLQRNVSADTLRLGCTPTINLFEKQADPFKLSQTQEEYLVDPDPRRVVSHEIYSIDEVEAVSSLGEVVRYQPFYSFKHGVERQLQKTFWHANWRPSNRASTPTYQDHGRDVYMTLVDLGFTPAQKPDWTVRVRTTCNNRDLPERLPSGVGRPRLEMPEGRGVIGSIGCLVHPTPTLRAERGYGAVWRLISQLSLNHLSISDSETGADALREILSLYDVKRSGTTRAMIEGVSRVSSERVVRRIGQRVGGFGRGVQVRLELDESKFSGGGPYLFASVLDRFMALYANINSFTELVVRTQQRGDREDPWRWPKRTGEQILL